MSKTDLRPWLLIFLFVVSCQSPKKKVQNSDYKDLVPVYDQLLTTLDNWTRTGKGKRDNVEETVQLSLAAIKAGKLGISLRPDLPENFFEGAQFYVDAEEQKPYVSVSPYVLRSFGQHPTIALSAVVHEMQHAQSYLADPETFRAVDKNLLERYLYELDAYHIEAKFILRYLANNPRYQLTAFEELLSRSFRENYLEEFSAKMLGHDMYLAMAIAGKYKKSQSEQQMIEDFDEILLRLEQTVFDGQKGEFALYLQLMPLYTVNQFLPYGLRYIYFHFHAPAPGNVFDFPKAYPGLYARYTRLAKTLEARRDQFFEVSGKIRERYTRL